MLGREKKNEPVCIASVAWKCSLSSDFIELISAMSPIRSRMWGSRSLTIVPVLPAGLKGQTVSRCDVPPVVNRKMTCLALAGKCEAFGLSGSARFSSARIFESRPGSRIDPPTRERMAWRRVQLSDIDKLVQAEEDPGETFPCLGLVELGADFLDELEGAGGFGGRRRAAHAEPEAAGDARRGVL